MQADFKVLNKKISFVDKELTKAKFRIKTIYIL